MKKLLLLTCISISVCLLGCKTETKKIEEDAETIDTLTAKELTDEETLDWVKTHADSVLKKNSYRSSSGLEMGYRLYSPEETEEKIPLVIFLHGRGDRGTDNGPQIYNNTGLFMNEMSLIAPNMQSKYPAYVLAPQCSDKTENEEWAKWKGNTPETPFEGLGEDGSYTMNETPSESGAAALELIEKLIDSLNIDPDRVYLIGKSMGGFGTWEFTARRPDLFAAAVPMAGYSDTAQVEKIKHIPYWIFHGDIDEYNPVAGSRNMYKLLQEAGADVKYTEYEGANHGDSFEKAFNDPELIKWMFSKKKKNNQ